ncbi:MAG: hypothetical protein JWM38_858 [Sphingomonas bacterium]|jgi:hypothetical protein|nr:hypothetical protein [Sphingomonas bacterium]MDB5685128.1 hypothetical protein [Sphingomonas bacterium]MDB5717431.1 hypothetical protein [Sphingomonas bacterium]
MPAERPPHLKPPAHWQAGPPPPEPEAATPQPQPDDKPNPTRYGDWERKGIAIDF